MDSNKSHDPSQPASLTALPGDREQAPSLSREDEIARRLAMARAREAEATAVTAEAAARAATSLAEDLPVQLAFDRWERAESILAEASERRVNLWMAVLVSVYSMVVLALGAAFHPWLIPVGAGVGGFAYVAERWHRRAQEPLSRAAAED